MSDPENTANIRSEGKINVSELAHLGIQDFQIRRKDCVCAYVGFYNGSGDKHVTQKYKSRQRG